MSKYFKELPSVSYQLKLNSESKFTELSLKSINTKVSFTDITKNSTDSFYPYVSKPGDRIDIVADFYYKNPDRYWIVLLSNDYADIYYDFTLQEQTFRRYLVQKYRSEALSNGYSDTEKEIIQYTIDTVKFYLDTDGDVIDASSYNDLPDSERGSTSIYEYETSLNEAKKEIQLVSNQYISTIERQFKDLMKDKI